MAITRKLWHDEKGYFHHHETFADGMIYKFDQDSPDGAGEIIIHKASPTFMKHFIEWMDKNDIDWRIDMMDNFLDFLKKKD